MVDKEKPVIQLGIQPDLVFNPEVPPIPTTLLAVNAFGGQGIIVQDLEEGRQYSIVNADRDWELVKLRDEDDALRAVRMTGMIPVETETGESVEYSSQAEAIADLRQEFMKVNPPPDVSRISLDDLIHLAPQHIQDHYREEMQRKTKDAPID